MEQSKMKTWQKVGLGIVTVGVTATVVYFGYKALKKRLAKKEADKKAAEPVKEVAKVAKK